MKIPLIDLIAQYRSIWQDIDAATRSVLEEWTFVIGQNVAALEEEMVGYLESTTPFRVAPGTDACS